MLLITKIYKSIEFLYRLKQNISTLATITAIRAPFRQKFLSPKAKRSIAAMTRGYGNGRFIDEFHPCITPTFHLVILPDKQNPASPAGFRVWSSRPPYVSACTVTHFLFFGPRAWNFTVPLVNANSV